MSNLKALVLSKFSVSILISLKTKIEISFRRHTIYIESNLNAAEWKTPRVRVDYFDSCFLYIKAQDPLMENTILEGKNIFI